MKRFPFCQRLATIVAYVLLLTMPLPLAMLPRTAFARQSNSILSISPAVVGTITESLVPTANSGPTGITLGLDGRIWFTEGGGNKIGRITPGGVIREFPVPTANSGPAGITPGPDGNLWFTEYYGDKIGRITTSGGITEFPIPTATSGPYSITSGSGRNLWFAENAGNKIGRITTRWYR